MRRQRLSSTAVNATICVALALLTSGCAASAVRPPTPAAELRPEELLKMPTPPGERYYLLLFGSERITRQPRYVHTWATMVRVTECSDGGVADVEPHTISWMPATLKIRPWNFTIEPGVNLEMHFTIQEMLRNHEDVVMWGPYEVSHGTYIRFLTQKAFMESGQVQYQCIDNIGEAASNGSGCDCIHAVSDMDPMFDRERYALVNYGIPATRNIVKQILTRPVVIDAPRTHDWLIPCLGIDRYPIERELYSGEVVSFSPEALLNLMQQGSTGSKCSLLSLWPGSSRSIGSMSWGLFR